MFAGQVRHRTPGWGLPAARGALAVLAAAGLSERARADWLSVPLLAADAVDPLAVSAVLGSAFTIAALFLAWRRALAREARAGEAIAQLEERLDEAGAVLTAEPHLLYIWRGKDALPAQVAGELRTMTGVPADYDGRVDFVRWIDRPSAARLDEKLTALRLDGTPFNHVVRTAAGELLEADGRAAGGLATLRLRMLTGERLEMSKLADDYNQLEQQAEALTAILDRVPLPIWIRDTRGAMTWANAAFLAAVEAPDLATAIAHGVELVSADDRDLALARVRAGETARQRMHAVIGGGRRALDVLDLPIANGSAGIALDITELEDARIELERHIQAHASTLDKIATAVAIFGHDQRLRFFNSAYAALWNLDPAWLAEHPSDGEILDRLRAERRLPEQADYRAWKARRMEAYSRIEDQEEWWHLPDGRTVRVMTEQHPFGGVTHLFENVTEQLSLASRYNELIGVQRETLDNLHEGVALFGSDGRLKLHNPVYESIWRIGPDKLEGEPHISQVIDLCRPRFDDDDAWDELKICVTSLGEGRRPLRARLNRPDASVVDFSSVPLPDGATLLTYVDVTDSSRIERALRERNDALETADRLKTEFISHVSYELRTPLTNIIGFTESMSLGIAGQQTPRQQEYTGHILTSSQTLLAIIDDILDLATIDAGVMELSPAEIDVAETLRSAAGLVQDRIRNRGLVLGIEIARNIGRFVADERRVKQILYNLLSNAIGFSPNGGRIAMGARREGDDVLLWVTDHGTGIEPERQSTVFERFETRSGGSQHRGAGLGLSIVKSLTELHGGSISLSSMPNEGTTVICCFPAEGPAAQRPAEESDDDFADTARSA
jgi:signal transduction histidine kinase